MEPRYTLRNISNHLDAKYKGDIGRDVREGLAASQKYVPCKYLYDVHGSKLFEDICHLPEYYLTRVEVSILEEISPQIMKASAHRDLIELGSGSDRKIRIMLEAAGGRNRAKIRYIPVDISQSAVMEATESLSRLYPELGVLGIVADFTRQLDVLPNDRPALFCFLGSTIGNFEERESVSFLKGISGRMDADDRLLVGFDMVKDRDIIETAYNDSQGLTAEFNRNVLGVLNKELDADFDPSDFDHSAFYNEVHGRIEMHLRARRDISVRLDAVDMGVELREGETIHTENAYKFTRSGIERIVRQADLSIANWHTDPDCWFSVVEMVSGS